MTLRPGYWYSFATVVLAIATCLIVRFTANAGVSGVTQLMVFAVVVVCVSLVFDLPQVLAATAVPVLGAVVIEVALADDPSWIRSLIIGCLWYVVVESGWESLERRDGSRRTPTSSAQRVKEVATVVVLALAIGAVAASAISFAPARTVVLQAVVLGLVVASFVVLVRRVTQPTDTAEAKNAPAVHR